MIVWVLIWYVAKQFAVGHSAASGRHNLRAWPLTLVVTAGALFGLIAGGLEFALGESPWSRFTASVVAAFVSVGLAPRLYARLFAPASPSTHLGRGRAPGDG